MASPDRNRKPRRIAPRRYTYNTSSFAGLSATPSRSRRAVRPAPQRGAAVAEGGLRRSTSKKPYLIHGPT